MFLKLFPCRFYRYKQLLADCHQCYFTQREALLGPSVANAITDLASKHARDHCALVSVKNVFFCLC